MITAYGGDVVVGRGRQVKVVSERLGHESISITLKHYAHALPSMQQRAAAAIEAIFSNRPTMSHRTR
jgi:integrase